MEKNYADWLAKTLEKESQSWQSGSPPEEDDQTGYFHTSEPIIIFQMVDQNLTVSLFKFLCMLVIGWDTLHTLIFSFIIVIK